MNIPLIMLIGGAGALIVTILIMFFGYKLARFVLPVCGVIALEFLLYLFVYDLLGVEEAGLWLFVCGTAVLFYVLLFLVRRISAFFTGLFGAMLLLLMVIYAFGLHGLNYLYIVFFTVSVIAGLMAAVYKRVGVIIASSVFGGSATALMGLYLIMVGIFATEAQTQTDLLGALEAFMISNGLLVLGVSVALSVIGALVQLFSTGRTQLLDNSMSAEDRAIVKKNRRRQDENTWVGGGRRARKGKNV